MEYPNWLSDLETLYTLLLQTVVVSHLEDKAKEVHSIKAEFRPNQEVWRNAAGLSGGVCHLINIAGQIVRCQVASASPPPIHGW